MQILEYAATSSNWSGDLTAMHEQQAGRYHPIDCASRALAVRSMATLSATKPIVLDVGCSSGFVLEDLAKAIPQVQLIGADYIREPLEDLARRIPNVPILQFDLRDCPLPDACVDGVTCLNVLEHIDADERALMSIHRILRPGGICHLEVPAGPELYDIYDEHLMHHRRYRLRDLVNMARRVGFEVEEATHLGFFIYPAFWATKIRNRRKLALPAEKKAHLVAQQIRSTRSSSIFGLCMSFELLVGHAVSFPWGIRCVARLRKK
ncbi:MAG TPA: class I SAM-dependent methyltransferase [Chthoniobacterales bacterium]